MIENEKNLIKKRDELYEEHRVEICQKTRDLFNHF